MKLYRLESKTDELPTCVCHVAFPLVFFINPVADLSFFIHFVYVVIRDNTYHCILYPYYVVDACMAVVFCEGFLDKVCRLLNRVVFVDPIKPGPKVHAVLHNEVENGLDVVDRERRERDVACMECWKLHSYTCKFFADSIRSAIMTGLSSFILSFPSITMTVSWIRRLLYNSKILGNTTHSIPMPLSSLI